MFYFVRTPTLHTNMTAADNFTKVLAPHFDDFVQPLVRKEQPPALEVIPVPPTKEAEAAKAAPPVLLYPQLSHNVTAESLLVGRWVVAVGASWCSNTQAFLRDWQVVTDALASTPVAVPWTLAYVDAALQPRVAGMLRVRVYPSLYALFDGALLSVGDVASVADLLQDRVAFCASCLSKAKRDVSRTYEFQLRVFNLWGTFVVGWWRD